MKIRLFTSLLLSIGLFASRSFAQTAAIDLTNGTNDLASQDLADANTQFGNALSLEPTNQEANFLFAVTRVLLLEQSPAGSNFLSGLGVPALGRDYYDWTARPATNSEGKPEFPKGYNSGTAISFYTNTLMPVISATLTNLANITDPTFQLFLPGTVTGGGAYQFQDVTVDYGDVQVLRSLLTAAQFFGYSLSANNADADMSWIETNIQAKTITFQSLLSQFPSLGARQNTAALAPSEQAATNAIELYFGAANFILNDRTNTDALFNLSTNDIPAEIEFQSDLTNILLALTTSTQFNSNNVGSTVYLAPYFNGDVSLRSLVPKFNGDAYVPDSVPDYTFGGILPDQPSYETESLLLKKFPNYAGIYIGDSGVITNGLSEGLYDVSYGGLGNFAAYIGTNGQLTVIGEDPGNYSGSEFGVLIQTTLGKGGNWQFSNSVVYASGNIDNSGDFFGYLQYTNGDQVNLTGYIAPALGLFQNSAGYYTGSYSGPQSGSLYSIVAADGEIFFTTGKTGPGGNDGGSGQFQYSYNNPILNEFITSELDGTTIYGVINTNSASVAGIASGSIMGLYTNNGVSGPFTMTRSSQVFSEVPPVITSDLPPGLAVVQGSTSTFRLGVSGSAPLSYQWYFNGNPVSDATTNTLVVSNISGTSEIYATVEDAVGEATSEVCVVTAETSVPPIASYAGIYVGNSADLTNGVSDSEGYSSGSFVVYVSTNGQMTVAGQDNGDGTGNNGNNFGFLFQTTLVNGGYFTYYNSYYTANGGIDGSGDFYASLNYPQANGGLGESVYLTGNLESPYGPFQNSDGLYTGTYSGANSGTLDVIFDANGDLSLVPLGASANGPYGNAGTGVFGQFSNSTQFSLTSSSGTIVSGTLNSGTFVINGNYTNSNNSHGSFTVSRSSKYVVPIPPVITSDLPSNLTVPLGNTVTFDVGAAGTAPLSYQWYFSPSGSGFNPIPGAYTNTLVVSNNLWTTTGTYYIYVTVANGAGETNSQTCTVNVVTETNIPTVTITSPKSGELWSNSTFIVTGTASDKFAVTDVVCVVDGTNYGTISTNNYNSWFVPVLLNSGSNTISAYAINEGPVDSKTSTVLMDYIVSAPMTVLTNGPGIISPNYNNVPLQLGKNYSMTATGDSHFMLTNWSSGLLGGGPLTVYTNKATVIFAMQSNLVMQANFQDTLAPYLKVTNATQGMVVWTNASFTVMGVATDDQEVATITYSLNGAPTTLPMFSDIAAWQAPLSLAEGTNIFKIYAQATNGNLSVTDTVDIVYAVSNLMTVVTNGPGTVAPNYNNQNLRVGENYIMTATGASHFMLTNWSSGLVGGPLTLYTNKPTAIFNMQSNLVMQANFQDALAPYLKVTNATQGMVLWTSSSFTVMGVATDDQEVASVTYSLNGAATQLPINSDIAAWQAPLSLAEGTNVFKVYAQATNGNLSVTDTVDLVYAVSNVLVVATNGPGTVAPNYNNQHLRDGENYSMTATGASHFMLTNWFSGLVGGPLSIYTNKPTAIFEMQSNLAMQANFHDTLPPFLKVTNTTQATVFWTNASFTVMGVATDDQEVASVTYSLNGAATQLLINSDIAAWQAPLSLA
ncbi:MAG TPA: Ig-like domain-containing protein, partial [Candidatus Acidoferrales bacterium]|nr:Ig-like domain-containing protein [Candidatus Acidoferrales bacterium]